MTCIEKCTENYRPVEIGPKGASVGGLQESSSTAVGIRYWEPQQLCVTENYL